MKVLNKTTLHMISSQVDGITKQIPTTVATPRPSVTAHKTRSVEGPIDTARERETVRLSSAWLVAAREPIERTADRAVGSEIMLWRYDEISLESGFEFILKWFKEEFIVNL